MDTTHLRNAYRALLDAARIAAGVHTTYDNRIALDAWTIDRTITLAGGKAGLHERLRVQGEALCELARATLSDEELDTQVPSRLLSNDVLLVDQGVPLRELVTGLGEVELPGHTRQLLALLPDGLDHHNDRGFVPAAGEGHDQ